MNECMNKPSRSVVGLDVKIEAQELSDLPSNSVFNKKLLTNSLLFHLVRIYIKFSITFSNYVTK